MVKPSSSNRKRGRPKGSKNKPKDTLIPVVKRVGGTDNRPVYAVKLIEKGGRYKLKSRIEKDALGADQCYYFIHDLKRGETYPEIIARFTVETEAKLCTEFLNGTRKISKKMYNKKRICII